MPHRDVSPAISETAFDISNDLLPGSGGDLPGSDHDETDSGGSKRLKQSAQDEAHAANHGNGLSSDDDDEAFIAAQQAASNRSSANTKGKSSKKGGAFQSMGINPVLLRAITRKGFSVPTPIQRKTIPLILDNQDVVGMARTGSGKTAAFVIPMIEKLKCHSVKVGARAIVLSPSRELALQTLKAFKEFGRGTDLRAILLVGGDKFEDQFSQMTSNPDIIIATPGRFLHLMVEMRLDLSCTRFAVFDEADRLFEMGFAVQLAEILHALPPSRQTLLFSATLPKSLVEFAKAGLQEPSLVRLDAESKISPDLESAFLTVKSSEKEGVLLHLLHDIIRMPTQQVADKKATPADERTGGKKRKREAASTTQLDAPTAYSTIIFAATKHHVEYLATLLRSSGFAISYVYGSLDQSARQMQVDSFRAGITSILVVTDVAARGIDIPMLANVINYDFPSQPKIFVHRVGRTARAGRKGWSYSLVQDSDVPYLLDLQLFLSRKLVGGWNREGKADFAQDIVVGCVPGTKLERSCEWVTRLLDEDEDLSALRTVASKGEKLYTRTRNSASVESAKRAKRLGVEQEIHEPNMLYHDERGTAQMRKEDMLARISEFRPAETVFEIGKRGITTETTALMRKRRDKIRLNNVDRALTTKTTMDDNADHDAVATQAPNDHDMLSESEDDLEVIYPQQESSDRTVNRDAWQDSEFFISYQPRHANLAEERGYGVHSGGNSTSKGSNFIDAARGATMDLNNDESKSFAEPSRPGQMRWDKRSKNYVAKANDEDGSRGKKLIRGESGQKIAASFRSGRFENWKRQNKVERMPKTGETEVSRPGARQPLGKRFKHYAERAPKQPDKFRDDFYKKKKKLEDAKNVSGTELRGKTAKTAKGELRSVEEVRKLRNLKEQRKEKNARPKRKRKG